jgi:hypothetical protein
VPPLEAHQLPELPPPELRPPPKPPLLRELDELELHDDERELDDDRRGCSFAVRRSYECT